MVKKVLIDKADRIYQMPPGLLAFAEAERKRTLFRREGIIDLASFEWPLQFDSSFRPESQELLPDDDVTLNELKEELAGWLHRRFQVRLVPDREIFVGGSITNLLYQLAMAFIDVGDVAFVPSLGIPAYRSAVTAFDGEPIGYSISAKVDWAPQFDRLNSGLGRVARLLFLNSPHNPTGYELSEKDLAELVWLAGKENILLVNDAAYAGLPHRAPGSLLSIKGSKRVAVELYSFSYLLGLPPLPLGFAVGNREVISGLKRVARLQPIYLPRYAVNLILEGLRHFPSPGLTSVRERIKSASTAADRLAAALRLEPAGQPGVPYLWARIERRSSSVTLARMLIKRLRLVVAPGEGFGENGEGYLRFCLLAGAERFEEANSRVEKRRLLKTKAGK